MMSQYLQRFLCSRIGDCIGDWNPQLLHELKIRLSWRSIVISSLLSIILQLLFVTAKFNQLPTSNDYYKYLNHASGEHPQALYCQSLNDILSCTNDPSGNPLINWQQWWTDISTGTSLMMFTIAATIGVYLIASSFRREQTQGTLDFLQLVPQRASTVLIGKLLGVPILVYLTVICALPLQIYAVQAAQLSPLTVMTWDLAMLGLVAMFCLGAELLTLRFKLAPIWLAIMTLGLSVYSIGMSMRWYGKYDQSTLQWYGIPLDDRPQTFLILTAMIAIVSYWLYLGVVRSYNRAATILSRGQSYLWSVTFHLFLLGFCIVHGYRSHNSIYGGENNVKAIYFSLGLHTWNGGGSDDSIRGNLPGVFWSLSMFWLLSLIPLLLPSVGSLTTWYKQADRQSRWWQSGWWKTRLWSDLSPSILAILVNIGIACFVWVSIILMALSNNFFVRLSKTIEDWLAILLNWIPGSIVIFVLMGTISTIAHLSLFWRKRCSQLWMVGLFSMVATPTICWHTSFGSSGYGDPFVILPWLVHDLFGRYIWHDLSVFNKFGIRSWEDLLLLRPLLLFSALLFVMTSIWISSIFRFRCKLAEVSLR